MKLFPAHKIWIVAVLFVAAVIVRWILGGVVAEWNDKVNVTDLAGRPYADFVSVEPGARYFYTWGVTASPRSKTIGLLGLPEEERYGDTYTQAHKVMTSLMGELNEVGLTLRDVVNVRAYVVGDGDNPPDFEGWDRAYRQFFGTVDNPHKPARTTVGISRLFIPQYRVEVEFVAVFPSGRGPFVDGSRHWLDWERSGRRSNETHQVWKSYGRPYFPMSTGKATDEGLAYFYSSAFMADTRMPMPRGMAPSPIMYGDITAQAASILGKIENALTSDGLSYRDVFFVRSIMFPERGRPIGGNFARFQREYAKFFTTGDNPNKPTRTVMSAPGYAVEGPLMSLEMYGIVPPEVEIFKEGQHLAMIGDQTAISSAAVAIAPTASKVWFSGVIAPTEGDLTAEFDAVWESVMAAYKRAGATVNDMVQARIYVKTENLRRDINAIEAALEAKLKHLETEHRPALTILPIVDLPGGARIEFETMAGVIPR